MQPFFITGSGTDIGKTLVMTALCWQLKQAGKTVTALKPVISGYNPKDMKGDAALILKSCGLVPSPPLMETIAPWRYTLALSPAMAASREGNLVDLPSLTAFCREHAGLASDVLLVEGVGGVMSPLSDTHTMLDWMEALAWPALLVVGSYLGAVSHALTAFEALRLRQVPVRAVIVSESELTPVPLEAMAESLAKFLPRDLPIVKMPRIVEKEEQWKYVPPIAWICDQ